MDTFKGDKSNIRSRCESCGWALGVHSASQNICPLVSEGLAEHWIENGFGDKDSKTQEVENDFFTKRG